ncbi:MAG: hypothetical protein R3250_00210 [Melioribacteraceae bacterium]|nr:hypothetical protein [Melioribacteraceae bacterium]
MSSKNNKSNELSVKTDLENLKIVGYYKRQVWAQKFFDKIDDSEIESDGKNSILVPSILRSVNNLFFPAFMSISIKKKGKVVGAYLITEVNEHIQLIPLENVMSQLKEESLLPFQYRTISKIPEDQIQINWPDFT